VWPGNTRERPGRIENCQIGVFLGYASRRGHALIDRRLYLPEEWTADAERCRQAQVPNDIALATKPMIARKLIAAALDAGVPLRLGAGRRRLRQRQAAAHDARAPRQALCVGGA